jgi:cobalt-zinc-cadmium efflux system outer membrane protein
MRTALQVWRAGCLLALAAGGALLAGCVTTSLAPAPAPALELHIPEGLPDAPLAPPEGPEGPLTLARLLDLTAQNNPDLAAARARADSARGKLVQAGLYPNPSMTARFDELNNPDGRIGMPGSTITQEIVTAHKIPLAKAAAAQGVNAADWQAMTRWFDVRTRVRLAYYELLTAESEVAANRELVRIAQEGLAVAQKLLKAGTGTQPDVLRASVDREQSQLRLVVSQRRLEAAGRLLAAAIGLPGLPGEGPEGTPLVVGTLERPAPPFAWGPLLEAVLTRSSEVQEAQALLLQAEKLVALAKANAWPNVIAQVRPFYSGPGKTYEMLVEVGPAIPIFNRNQGNILSAQADVAAARANARAVELRLTERLTAAYQRYQVARQQAATYEQTVLPSARESLRLVRLGYERGDPKYDYTSVLQAQQILAQARLAQVQALGELWRAVSDIVGLLQHDAAAGAE